MLLERVWNIAKDQIFTHPDQEGLFNPYKDRTDLYDIPGADRIRQENFRQYLASYTEPPRLFLLAEAPGPWGCRFSGVPLVSESQLVDPSFPIDGYATSLEDKPHSEYTANIYWRVLGDWFPQYFTWNTVPFHPYKPEKLLSIRNPRNSEVASFLPLIDAVLDAVSPERVLAIGRKAEYALQKIGRTCTYIRHPSQGGAKKFEEGVLQVIKEMNLSTTK